MALQKANARNLPAALGVAGPPSCFRASLDELLAAYVRDLVGMCGLRDAWPRWGARSDIIPLGCDGQRVACMQAGALKRPGQARG